MTTSSLDKLVALYAPVSSRQRMVQLGVRILSSRIFTSDLSMQELLTVTGALSSNPTKFRQLAKYVDRRLLLFLYAMSNVQEDSAYATLGEFQVQSVDGKLQYSNSSFVNAYTSPTVNTTLFQSPSRPQSPKIVSPLMLRRTSLPKVQVKNTDQIIGGILGDQQLQFGEQRDVQQLLQNVKEAVFDGGMVNDALQFGIMQQVCEFEDQVCKLEGNPKFYIEIRKPVRILRLLQLIVDMAKGEGAISTLAKLSSLYYGSISHSQVLDKLMDTVQQPFVRIIIQYISLDQVNLDVKDLDFVMNDASQIASLRDNVKFLREDCSIDRVGINQLLKPLLQAQNVSQLESQIQGVSQQVVQKVLLTLKQDLKLEDHLHAVHKWMLGGRGDFQVCLVEQLDNVVDSPRHAIMQRMLNAMEVCNSDLVNSHLDFKLLATESGWDSFSLIWRVEGALSKVITEQHMLAYRRISNTLLKVRRVLMLMEASRSVHMTFMKQLQQKLYFQIIQVSFSEFITALSECKTWSDVSAQHGQYLSMLEAKIFDDSHPTLLVILDDLIKNKSVNTSIYKLE